MNHDLNTALKGRIQSQENIDESTREKQETTVSASMEDCNETLKEEERINLSDSNILQYEVPKFREQKILGK